MHAPVLQPLWRISDASVARSRLTSIARLHCRWSCREGQHTAEHYASIPRKYWDDRPIVSCMLQGLDTAHPRPARWWGLLVMPFGAFLSILWIAGIDR